MKLTDLFLDNLKEDYIKVGQSVSYKFRETDDTLIIQLESSSELIDWIRNFKFKKRPYRDMLIPYKVHGGFLEAWKEIEDIIIEKVKSKDWQHIIVVGYSHGASLAVLCHECVWYNIPHKERVTTYAFEPARVYGSWKVKPELLERWKNFYWFRNHNDLVTHVPPWLLGYCHVGNRINIGKNKKYGPLKSHYPQSVYDSLVEYEKEQQ